MKPSLIFLLLLLSTTAFSQRLTMYKTFGGAKFTMDSTLVTNRQLSEILSIDPQASVEFKSARKKQTVASIIGVTGAALVIVPVATAIIGGEPEWLMAGAGALLIAAYIPFDRSFKNKAQNAVDGFNVRHPDGGTARRTTLHFNGAGLTLKF